MSDLDLERDAQPAAQHEVVAETRDVSNNDAVKEYISRLNEDDKKRRLKLQKEREDMLKELEAKERALAEKEKSMESLHKLAEKLDSRAIAQQLKKEAEAEGLIDFDLLAFVDRSSVKVTDDGDVIGAREAIQKLKEKKTFAFRKPLTTIARADDNVPPELSDLLKPVDNNGHKSQAEFLASIGVDAF